MIKIRRVWLDLIYGMLDPERLILKPSLSRCRNKFLIKVNEDRVQFNKDKNEIMLNHVTKDKDGNPVWQESNGVLTEGYFDFNTLDQDSFKLYKQDMEELYNEYFIFGDVENETNNHILGALKIIFKELDIVFNSKEEAAMYDEICEQLEIPLEV